VQPTCRGRAVGAAQGGSGARGVRPPPPPPAAEPGLGGLCQLVRIVSPPVDRRRHRMPADEYTMWPNYANRHPT
jgi:hypothetical protein